ncbi:MAG: 2,3-diphosphoglycerate synthetase [Actinobacteria bacterium]|nr:2,3-diphosphoglycerate synthetase [Actinomycetota bacterium]
MKHWNIEEKSEIKRVVALIDGEHYPQVTLDAITILKELYPGKVKGIIFMGGTEKLVVSDLESYFGEKVFTVRSLEQDFIKALDYFNPDLIFDLSDEPVVNYCTRMKIASLCFAKKCSYMGPDFWFKYEDRDFVSSLPTIGIIGTGKRIGKTAISAFVSKFFSREEKKKVCVVAMGRGGPAVPEVLKGDSQEITPQYLLELSNRGFHASSDYIEDALMSKIPTIGCRRCGGGFGGKTFTSNVREGILEAEMLNPDLIIVEGSGASLPDVVTDVNICVTGAYQDWESLVGYLGIYRLMLADLVVLTMCEEPLASEEDIDFLTRKIREVNPGAPIIKSIFRPQPLSDITSKKVFITMTAKEGICSKIKNYVEKKFNCNVVGISFNLSNREKLRKDLEEISGYDLVLTELKAASVDIVTDFAIKSGKQIVYMNNIPIILGGDETLFKEKLKLIYEKAVSFKARNV